MSELESYLSNIARDNTYHVIKVLKESAYSRTEKVLSPNGGTYIRKYFSIDVPGTENEWRLLAQLDHPSLPKVFEYYELSGKGVLIEEYIEGVKLSDLITTLGTLPEPKAIAIAQKICKTCLYLHQQQSAPIIHRDIKPDNIICTLDGDVKLIDFGSARKYKRDGNKDTVYLGTIGYAPPEQFGFGQTDTRADVYSIGMTLINMLTGQVPERGQRVQLSGTNISVSLQRVIQRATQFDPDKRYDNVSILLSELNKPVAKRIDVTGIIEAALKNPNNLYPKKLNWPVCLKILIIPVHIVLFLTFFSVIISGIATPTGYGRADDLIRFLNNFGIFFFMILPAYVLGFNLFNVNEKIPFFHKMRAIKKIIVIVMAIIAGGVLISILNGLHSEAYQLAQNLAGS